MKLYYSPFAASLAAHIVCREAGLAVTLHRADLVSKQAQGQADLRQLNPMGQVPTLVTDTGRVLTENCAVLPYLADRAPAGSSLRRAPGVDGHADYELVRWLSFVATELHKRCLWPIFSAGCPEPVKAYARESAPLALAAVERHLASRDGLLGSGFSVADAFLWWALTVMPHGQISLEPFPALRAFQERHAVRPAVVAAVSFERAQYKKPFESTSAATLALP